MAILTLTTVSNLHCLSSYLTTPSDLYLSAASAKSANVQCATPTVETEMTSFPLVAPGYILSSPAPFQRWLVTTAYIQHGTYVEKSVFTCALLLLLTQFNFSCFQRAHRRESTGEWPRNGWHTPFEITSSGVFPSLVYINSSTKLRTPLGKYWEGAHDRIQLATKHATSCLSERYMHL